MKKQLITAPSLLFFLSILLISNSCFSQPKSIEKIRNFVWEETNQFSEIPEIPQKWQNESAVVIFADEKHFYNKSGRALDNFFLTRKIIKLNDKAAVEKFSEFNYPTLLTLGTKTIKTWMGIRIIKPDGSVKEIDVENIKVKTSTDEKQYIYGFIRINNPYSNQLYKLAIPELEVEDVIDYYIYTYEEYRTVGNHVMEPVETTISSEYPIMDFKLKLKVENDFFINFNTFNGAPELKDVTNDKQRDKEYELSISNIEKAEPLQWIFPLVEYPSYKYQITFAKSGKYEGRTFAFLSEKEDIIKKNVNADDIIDEYKSAFKLNEVEKELKKYFKDTNLSKKELAEAGYYYMRHFYLNQYLESIIAYKEDLTSLNYPFSMYKTQIIVHESNQFLNRYGSFLKEYDIPFEIIATKKRYDGNIDNLLIRENLRWLIKINLDEPLYASPITSNSFFNWVSSLYEGEDGYALIFDEKYNKIERIEKISFPNSNHIKNNTKKITSIHFNDDLTKTYINSNTSFKGQNKMGEIDDLLFVFDYMNTEYEEYKTIPYADLLKKKNKETYKTRYAAYQEKLTSERLKSFEDGVNSVFDTKINDYSFEVTNLGRHSLEELLQYKEEFTIEDEVLKKVGPNYIFEIGKFIGGQIAIEENNKNRNENIYMPYAKSFNYDIVVTIPDGFTVSGIEKLNHTTENETGGFTSKATIQGNILTVTTLKYYSHNYEPNKNWRKMLEFLEPAYQFSQEKILLKKL